MSDLIPIPLLEDEPVGMPGQDGLGMEAFARIVAGAAVGTAGPFTIGIYARWGLGKTSVLRQAKRLIEDSHPEVVTVWFNAWQFEQEEHPIIPLVGAILRQVEAKEGQLAGRTGKAIKKIGVGLRKTGAALRSLIYAVSGKLGADIPGLGKAELSLSGKDAIQQYEKLLAEHHPAKWESMYQGAFDALREAVEENEADPQAERPKIVVFIDDLDRCLPDKALKLLESMKLALAQRGFIFVLAVDREVIYPFLQKRFEQDFNVSDGGALSRMYLDKIVQLPLPLPDHHEDRFKSYIEWLLNKEPLKSATEAAAAIRGVADVLALGSGSNPRSLVRFINNLLIDTALWRLRDNQLDAESMRAFAVSRILQQNLPDRDYRYLWGDDELCDLLLTSLEQPVESWSASADQQIGSRFEHRTSVAKAIQRNDLLLSLCKSDAGKGWLEDGERRRRVNQFLQTEREAPETGLSQAELVTAALQRKLAITDGREPSEEERIDVTELDLSYQSLGDKGLEHIRGFLRLQSLLLRNTEITDKGLKHLKELKGLKILSMNGTQVGDKGLAHLRGLLELTALGLHDTQVGDDGLLCLKALARLQRLYLSKTRVSDKGLEHLKDLRGLLVLNLINTKVSDTGLAHLAGLTALQALYLDSTQVGNEGLKHLKGLTGLQTIGLNGTRVNDSGLEHLSALTNLQRVYLKSTAISDKGLVHLAKLGSLQNLDLRMTNTTEQAVSKLAALLPKAIILSEHLERKPMDTGA